jgi:hypothetical protein
MKGTREQVISEILLLLSTEPYVWGTAVYEDVEKCMLKKFSTKDAAALLLMVRAKNGGEDE